MSGLRDIAKTLKLKLPIVQSVFQEIIARVASGEKVKIKNFGTFRASVYPGRELKSPKVNGGKPLVFPDSVALKFRQSQRAKQTLNRMDGEVKAVAEMAATAAPKAAAKPKAPKAEKAPKAPAEAKPEAAAKPAKAPKVPKQPKTPKADKSAADAPN